MTAEINQQNRFHPRKFALYLGIASMLMLFAAFTSAFLVRKGQGNWQLFYLPTIFWFNTAVILLSSFTIHRALVSFRRLEEGKYKLWLTITFILGCTFLIGQYIGWEQLSAGGIHLNGNPSGSFLYVISGAHAVHIAGGLLIMLITMMKVFFKPFNPSKQVNVEMMAIYWHFVDVLWIYLFIFFQINLT